MREYTEVVDINELRDIYSIKERVALTDKPIIIKENGQNAVVVMSVETFAQKFITLTIRKKLSEVECEMQNGVELLNGEEVLKNLRKKYEI